MIQITDLNHVTLVVRDLDASRRFYREVLGMVEAPRPERMTTTFQGAWMRQGSAEIHLIQADWSCQPAGDAPAVPNERADVGRARHIAFAVADLDAARAHLAGHGVAVVLGPRGRGDGVTQMYCYDPDGHLIELHDLP